jgi:hypothetical protein
LNAKNHKILLPEFLSEITPKDVSSTSPCIGFNGTWTGFSPPTNPLFDEYLLQWEDETIGSFTSIVVNGTEGWTFGRGQIDYSTNASVQIEFDNGISLKGNLSKGCKQIDWDNDTRWGKLSQVKSVHVIHMNHLDVGYNGIPEIGFINNVLQRYFDVYFPRGIAVIAALRELGDQRLIYTTHPWLVDLYLHCPSNFTLANITLQCPSPNDVAALKTSMKNGDFVMHAAPMNMQYGNAVNGDLIDVMFNVAKRISTELGIHAPFVASTRDVPGSPRSLIPHMRRSNITALTIGVNNYAPSPLLPNPGVWIEPTTGEDIIIMRTPQSVGYPNNPPSGLDPSNCVIVDNFSHALCWYFRTDNSGPAESVEEVLGVFATLRENFPGADVFASTYENYVTELSKIKDSLPTTSSEAGETWLTGCPSDPVKQTYLREATRTYSEFLANGQIDPNDSQIWNFTRMLIKLPEHTWGTPSLDDSKNFKNEDFHRVKVTEATFLNAETSWKEQRDIVALGAAYIKDHPLGIAIAERIAALQPSLPSPANAGYQKIQTSQWSWTRNIQTSLSSLTSISFDSVSGAFNTFVLNGLSLASENAMLGMLLYRTYNDTDVAAQHITVLGDNCCCCYGWTGMQLAANPESMMIAASLVELWSNVTWSANGSTVAVPVSFYARLSLPAVLNTYYGAPGDVWVKYDFAADGQVYVDLQLFNKTSTRLGEAIFFDFTTEMKPSRKEQFNWYADVLGYPTDPNDMLENGSLHQHGVKDGVFLQSATSSTAFYVDSLDASVASPHSVTEPPTSAIIPLTQFKDQVNGWAFILFQNFYNTNYPLYSVESDFKFRFKLRAEL